MFLPECFEVQYGWANSYSLPAGHSVSLHFTESDRSAIAYRIRLVTSGSVDFSAGQQHWQVDEGSVLFLPAVTEPETRMVHSREPSESLVVGFRLLLFGSIDITDQLKRRGVWTPDPQTFHALVVLIQLLLGKTTESAMQACLIRDGAIRTILGLCWEALNAADLIEGLHPQIPKWLDVVMQELRHVPSLTVKDLAQLTGYSHSQFDRLFQQYVGISPRVYVQHYRINLAKHLLETTDMGVMEIAEHLGFANGSDFARFFRRMSLDSPSNYRQRMSHTIVDLLP